MSNSTQENIICTLYICAYCLHWEKLTRRNLFQCSGTEYIINTIHRKVNSFALAHITYTKFNLVSNIPTICLQKVAHIVLLLLITTQDTNFFDIRIKKPTKNGITEAACTTCN